MRDIDTRFFREQALYVWLVVSEERRAAIDKRIQKALNAQYAIENSEVITQTISQLDEYFPVKDYVWYSSASCRDRVSEKCVEWIIKHSLRNNDILCSIITETG